MTRGTFCVVADNARGIRRVVRTHRSRAHMRGHALRRAASRFAATLEAATTSSSAIRAVSTSTAAAHGGGKTKATAENSIEITFIDRDGDRKTVRGIIGESLMETAHANDVELEGACEGSLACSTCHVVLPEAVFASLPEACDDENDMLDLAYGLTETSRLGCQVSCAKGPLDGCEVVIPSASRNFAVDGFKPKPH